MTTETGCRVSAEELKYDRISDELRRRIDSAYREKRAQFALEITPGEVAEAADFLAEKDDAEKIVSAYLSGNIIELGRQLNSAIESWLSYQASKEVERMIERGEV